MCAVNLGRRSVDEVLERGRAQRAQLGLQRPIPPPPGFDAEYQDFLDRYVFGSMWSRTGLDMRTRSAITVAMLMALGRSDQLGIHLHTALGNGLTPEELREIIFHGAVYCGVPSANAAFKVADEILGPSATSEETE
jgi:alkylhydroperoxidase/carboxymuconolactone decarboxylase family protein YurZ